jgi:hypothetical protein
MKQAESSKRQNMGKSFKNWLRIGSGGGTW